jgi:hypothetical protein
MSDGLDDSDKPFLRWHVVAHYRTNNGLLDVHHDIEELAELHDLIEQGPNWYCLVRIEITRNYSVDDETMTVESSLTL